VRVSVASVQQVLGLFDRTAWIITSSHGDQLGGLVATFVDNASLVPALPRLATGIARHHHTWDLIQRSRSFVAHLGGDEHCELFWRFGIGSGRNANKFADVAWRRGRTGSPVLDGTLGWLECAVETEFDIGDRTIYVAAILDGNVNAAGAPLTAKRLWELADDDHRRRLTEERSRDEAIDAAAIAEWRSRITSRSSA
jgi:flavin reductase (DIM6/NTAB) family NADH-FMN oxidoreductase RutF